MLKKCITGVLVLACLCVHTLTAQEGHRIFKNVNGECDEHHPVLSPDGQVLYFTRSHHLENMGGRQDIGDIWYSTLTTDKKWSSPKNARSLNNKGYNGVIGFSSDGATIYLHNHYTEYNGIVKSQGIAKATRKRGEWSAPEDIEISYFKNLSLRQGGYISKDGKVLVLSIESYGTKGAEDIYVSLKNDQGRWSEPINLGSTINTKYQEFSPFLSDDNKTLYFSSNGHGGKGSSDIFMAKRRGEGWKQWSEPQGLDKINTKGRDTGYRNYGDLALYSSTINSDGYSDLKIYTEKPLDSVMLVAEPVLHDTTTVQNTQEVVVETPEADADGIILYGKVLNVDNRELVNAIVTVRQRKVNFKKEVATQDVRSGYYSMALPAADEYEVRIDAPGYISKREQLDVDATEGQRFEVDYLLQPIAVGTTVNLSSVLFQQSTANILEISYKELDLVADLMKQNPSMKIRLEGHTDNRGLAKHNQKLSKKRAEAVEDYLVSQGISSRRISGKGYGGSKPIADNNDPEKRKLNRRVEFTIVKE